MSTSTGRHTRSASFEESDLSGSEIASNEQGVLSEYGDHGKKGPPVTPKLSTILCHLEELRRHMDHHFLGLCGDLKDTNRRIHEQNQRLDETNEHLNKTNECLDKQTDCIDEKLAYIHKRLDDTNGNIERLRTDTNECLDSRGNGTRINFNIMDGQFERLNARFDGLDRRFQRAVRRVQNNDETSNKQQADTAKRFDRVDKRFDEVDKRFDEVDKRFDEVDKRFDSITVSVHERFLEQNSILEPLQIQSCQLNARQANDKAIHTNDPIQPVRCDDGTPIPASLFENCKYVHEFLRLRRRKNLPRLTSLIRYYDSQSWPTWGLVSFGDDGDVTEPLKVHESLEEAISSAPVIALQNLARYLGLDYDKISVNAEENERNQRKAAESSKRAMADEPAAAKRERLETSEMAFIRYE